MFVTRGCLNPELLSPCVVSDTKRSSLSPTLPRPPWSLPEAINRAEPQSNPSLKSPPQKPTPRIQSKLPTPTPPPSTPINGTLNPSRKRYPKRSPKRTDPRNQNPKKASLTPWPGGGGGTSHPPNRQTTHFPNEEPARNLIGTPVRSLQTTRARASCNMHLPCTESGAGELSMG